MKAGQQAAAQGVSEDSVVVLRVKSHRIGDLFGRAAARHCALGVSAARPEVRDAAVSLERQPQEARA